MKSKYLALSTIWAAVSAQVPPAASVSISNITYSGTGCPAGTVSTILSDAKDLVTFGFDSFQAMIGPTVPKTDSRKDCRIRMAIAYASGYSVTVSHTVYHGYTRLDDGINAKFTTDYDFGTNRGKKVCRCLFVLLEKC
jgi:Domain of unknown function (DUF4360)